MRHDDLEPSPYIKANFFSRLFFCWLHRLLFTGYRRPLDLSDLYQTLPKDRSQKLGDRMQSLWEQEVIRSDKKPSLRRVIVKQFGGPFMLVGLLAFVEECVIKIGQPLLLGFLIRYFSEENRDIQLGWLLASGVVMGSVCFTLTHHRYFFGVQHVGMQMRVACCSVVYRKALRLSQASLGQTTIGQMVNLLSNDVNRFDQATLFQHYLWIGPVQTVMVAVILWFYYDFGVTCLSGVSVLLLFIPFQGYTGKQFSKFRNDTAQRTDKRIRLMNEIIGGMKIIKMYAWEKPFSLLVGEARKEEIQVIRSTNNLRSINMSLFYVSSKLIVFITLLTYVLTGHPLRAEQVFVTLALYNNVRLIMTLFFPVAVSQLAEVLVSVDRIQDFLVLEERDGDGPPVISQISFSTAPGIRLSKVFASWTSEQSTVKNISLAAEKNDLIAIIGPVGSGKSSLLQVMLGELKVISGAMKIHGSIAYTSQDPWIFGGTIKQNIVFGKHFDETWYKEVIDACALERDLELFPYGDETFVGDKGTSLSGGQRARVSLARAVYANADIYLLDDPLSAVDSEVARHLFENCVCGILKDKIRILVTHQTHLLTSLEHVLLLEDGEIKKQGCYATLDIDQIPLEMTPIPRRRRQRTLSSQSSITIPHGSFGMEGAIGGSLYSVNLEFEQKYDETGTDIPSDMESPIPLKTTSSTDTKMLISYESKKSRTAPDELMASGRVDFGLFVAYFKAGCNCFTGWLLIFSDLATQCLYGGTDWFLGYWTKSRENKQVSQAEEPPHKDMDIYIYSGLVGGLFIFSFIRTIVFFGICMTASVNLHERMFLGLLKAPMKFYEENPVGRILNRISKDVGCIDEQLPPTMFDTMEIFLSVIGITVIVAIINAWLLIPALFLGVIFYNLRKFYLVTARSIKRIEGIARSPVFSHLSTSLYGLTTIRSFKAQKQFIQQFDEYQDIHTASWYIFISASRWFGVWLDWISVFYIGTVTFSFMIWTRGGADVGLAISSAMIMTGMFQWGVRQSAETENLMVSVERVMEYTHLEREKDLSPVKPPSSWPQQGEITFTHVNLWYRKDAPALVDVTFHIRAEEKIGIVGRTGAGKSSLITTLFRISEPTGSIIIDEVNVLEIGLHDLRSKISIIPQEPVLFMGTLRRNLDPFGEYQDGELWMVLEDVQLANTVREQNGLEMEVTEAGGNFSVGERQLLCLARAILRNNKILVLDEATANVDQETDKLIQQTIRSRFKTCTVLTVAHRLHTIMDCDRIMVLDAGMLVEFDESYTLLQNTQSALYGLADQSGALEDLISIAKEAADQRQNEVGVGK